MIEQFDARAKRGLKTIGARGRDAAPLERVKIGRKSPCGIEGKNRAEPFDFGEQNFRAELQFPQDREPDALRVVVETYQIDASGFIGCFGGEHVFDEVLALTNEGDIAGNWGFALDDAGAEESWRGRAVANAEGLEKARGEFLACAAGGIDSEGLTPCA